MCWISVGPASACPTPTCGCEASCSTFACREIYEEGEPTGVYEVCMNLAHPPNDPLTKWRAASGCGQKPTDYLKDPIHQCGELYNGYSCDEQDLSMMGYCGGYQAVYYAGC